LQHAIAALENKLSKDEVKRWICPRAESINDHAMKTYGGAEM
jgi:hypothetical protein